MELAYRLAVEESPFIRQIRDSIITLITPVTEVDERDRMVDIYRYRRAHHNIGPNLIYWGRYTAHDNNRDGIVMSQVLTQTMLRGFFTWHPTVLHDLHESVPFLYGELCARVQHDPQLERPRRRVAAEPEAGGSAARGGRRRRGRARAVTSGVPAGWRDNRPRHRFPQPFG